MSNSPLILCQDLVKIYKAAEIEVVALQGLDLQVEAGEIVALVGASGSGKSTLLNILGGFDLPSAGSVFVANHNLLKMSQKERVAYKRKVIGFVWQQPSRNLLPYLTAKENILMPLAHTDGKKRALALLDFFGLQSEADRRPAALSGGQQQRIALAVALANDPQLILADEPTGQLDSLAVNTLFDNFRLINQEMGTTILLVTHDPAVAARVDRVVSIQDGRTSTEIRRHQQTQEHEEEWVIIDRVGRLQIPAIYLETFALKGRVKLRSEADHLSLWPGDDAAQVPKNNINLKQWRPEATFILRPDMRVAPPSGLAVRAENLTRRFGTPPAAVTAVNNINLSISQANMVLIKGRSGSGKTTLLNLLGGLDVPSSGEIWIYEQPISRLSETSRAILRRQRISFIFQTFGLLPFLSAQENIEVVLRLLDIPYKEQRLRSGYLLELVGLGHRSRHRVNELSGGEQQRIAIARALASRPWLLLADEPTGQLDTTTGADIISLLKSVVEQLNSTVIIASHDAKVAEAADYVLEMEDGFLKPLPGQV